MTLETQVSALVESTTALLQEVTVSKATLDQAVTEAQNATDITVGEFRQTATGESPSAAFARDAQGKQKFNLIYPASTAGTSSGLLPIGAGAYLDDGTPQNGDFFLPGDGSTWLPGYAPAVEITNQNAGLIDFVKLPKSMKSSFVNNSYLYFGDAIPSGFGNPIQSYASNSAGNFASTCIYAGYNRKFIIQQDNNSYAVMHCDEFLPAIANSEVYASIAYEHLTSKRGVAVTSDGKIYCGQTSDYGPTNYIPYTLNHSMDSGNANSVICGRGKWLVNGMMEVVVSSDGINWTVSQTGVTSITRIYYDNNNSRFILFGSANSNGSGSIIKYSTDGVTWTTAYSSSNGGGARWMNKVNNLFVFALNDGTFLHSADGISNFTAVSVSNPYDIGRLHYDATSGRYVADGFNNEGIRVLVSFSSPSLTDPIDAYSPMGPTAYRSMMDTFPLNNGVKVYSSIGEIGAIFETKTTRAGISSLLSNEPIAISSRLHPYSAKIIPGMVFMRRVK